MPQETPPSFEDVAFALPGGLSMRARLYRGGPKTLALCIPGLTRNARDFEELAPKVAATGRDVLVVSLRGRGGSDDDPDFRNYFPPTYRDDVLAALDQHGAKEAVFIGTSLGGIVTMLTNHAAPARVRAAVLNDVGPALAPEGIARIAGYVGDGTAAPAPAANLDEAAARIKAINDPAFPDADDDFWRVFAQRTFKETADGRWTLDYDPNIARALVENGPAPDLEPAFASLKDKPTLIVRGEISDLLTPPIIEEMRAAHPSFDYAEVPRVGHAPMLTEPAAWKALEAFLTKID